MAKTQRRNGGGKNRVMNVRIADPAAGTDGLKVDRQIAAIKTSESQTRVVIGDILDVGIPTNADISASYGFDNIANTDDFASLAAQYNLYRIVSIKFDIVDTNPSAPAYNVFGVWHDNYEGANPAFTRANIADLPDSRVISGGTGQTTLYWVAHGVTENLFNATTTTGSPVQKFGGLKYYVGIGGANVSKYTISIHAVVDFRGRR